MTTGFAFSKFQPLRCVEDVCVFYKRAPTYNPQGIIIHDKPIISRGKKDKGKGNSVYHFDTLQKDTVTNELSPSDTQYSLRKRTAPDTKAC